ncbi:MAG: SpoIID/LytB domain-containing protein [Phycisphaerales bacterium]|nr:MAG: SpoIID/LytB domain-containing protein [Phycisphaerales bacterium]
MIRRFMLALLVCVLGAWPACRERAERPAQVPRQVHVGMRSRNIRVLILSQVNEFQVRIDGPYVVRNPATGVLGKGSELPWSKVSRSTGDFTVGDRRWTAGTIDIVPEEGTRILISRPEGGKWSSPIAYAGFIRCPRRTATTMNVINVVDIERYVAGVLARELYADFQIETYRAQAVAARTYALWQMATNAHRAYDVRATEASQVYGGIPTGPAARKAYDAVVHTRGIVCTWTSPQGERIFCTYYSSACGGRTQAVSDMLDVEDITPLAGGVQCNYCRIAQRRTSAYRWGPASVSKAELTRRLARRFPSARSIGTVDRIEVASRAKSGRPARIRVIGTNGRQKTLRAEQFRLAAGARVMRSSDCEIVNGPSHIQFTHGKGFGHGVGLCQWGMEGQALLGRQAGQILKFYYPGMHLTRAY